MHAFKSAHHYKVLSDHMPLFLCCSNIFRVPYIPDDYFRFPRSQFLPYIRWSLRVRFLKNPALPHFQLIFCMQSYPDNPIAFAQSTWPALVWSPKKFSSTRKVGKVERLPLKCSSEYKIFTLEFTSVLCWLIFHEQSPIAEGITNFLCFFHDFVAN